jgi:5'-3' exonuclease
MKNYILIDMSNIEHRCKHIQAYDVDIKAGMALQIALNSFRQMWRKFNGNHLVVCLEGRSWRKDVYPDYKAHRQSLLAHRTKKEIEDDEFYFTTMREFTKFLADKTNVTVLQSNIGEADDLIARWIFLHPEDKHIVCSGDTDFYQLLSDNVTIYDAVKNWTISSKEVLNEDDKPAVSKKNVKIKDIKSGKQISKLVETRIAPPVAEYELFKKIIRGDASDNIMSAYPGAREHGSLKKPGIKEAFDDRIDKGYEWNQFMLHEWNKLIGVDADDN